MSSLGKILTVVVITLSILIASVLTYVHSYNMVVGQ